MVRRKKVGKERLDRFYQLAKEQGYRARSAFKLIQLEKKYGFLKNARSCVDLCGAPGGWSQVAAKHMPANSKVICVDLMPIKPIKGVVTMQCDITTQKCRQFLLKELNGTPCDVVLNDGAPNVGASWAKDAYNQAELCLYAVHLAADMLRKGGTFVTKVFRSSDYNSLLWVFQQLFEKVEATKPTASRNVSAEIFVTCKGFKAPARVDPRLFDPKWVFMMEGDEQEKAAVGEEDEEEITGKKAGSSGAAALNDYLKSAMKRRRGGYEDESELFSTATVAEFIASPAPAEVLIKRSKLVFATEDCEAIRKSPYTTPEILDYMSDLKVLGKGELMALLKWRMRIRRDREKASKVNQENDGEEEDEEEEEEDTLANARPGKSVDDELAALLSSRRREEKAELKKQRERTKKQEMRKKMSLGGAFSASSMYEPDLFGGITQDDFEAANEVDEDVTALEGSEEDPTDRDIQPGQYEYIVGDNSSRLERMEKEMSEYHKNELRDAELRKEKAALKAKKGKKETRRERAAQEWAAEAREVTSEIEGKAVAAHEEQVRRELAGVSDDEDGESVDGYESDEGGDAAYVDGIQEDDDDEKGDSSDGEVEVPSKRSKESKASEEIVLPPEMSGAKGQIRTDRWFSQELFKEDSDDDDEMKDDVDGIRELDDEDLLKLPLTDKQLRKEKRKRDLAKKEKKEAKRARKMGEVEEEGDGHGHKDGDVAGTDVGGFEVVPASTASAFERPEDPQELAETLALGSLLTSKKSRMELIDSAYNRYTFADDHNAALPDWFVEEEKPFTRQMVPISKELMNQYRAKMREINARPVRKVAEAAARKKKRLTQQLEKLRKTATSLQESSDLGDSGKARAMRKAVGKVLRGNDKKEVAYAAVQGKGGSKVISKGASRGAKVKMVDKRLKNDKRAQKRADKRLKKAGAKRRAKKLPQKKKGKGM